jgi:16S rRNA (guanine527-N7)-methyltransferase
MSGGEAYLIRIQDAMAALGMDADGGGQAMLMLRYLEQLQRWNRTYNLTALRDPEAMLVQHVFDSLAVVPVLRTLMAGQGKHVVDMGSGAGLPGIILAICEPAWQVTCVDAVQKKTAFIQQAAGVLGLRNVRAVHGRIEAIDPLAADLVISRAFASLRDFARVSERHLADPGIMLAMKGRLQDDERMELERETDWRIEREIPLRVPELDAQRCLIHLGIKGTHDS